MMKHLYLIALLLLPLSAQQALPPPETPLPFDPSVRRGTLDNGMTYYVRQNAKPEDRLELRLVVRAGSAVEADDQQGLAHYLEHMAFNGSTHFEKQELVDFLESIGMGFGSHLNAYTSFDETVYMLQVPTEDMELVDKALLVLDDWAQGITLADDELEKERGVIVEEWRGRRGARQRIMDEQLPVILQGSRYAVRMPIGKREVIDNFEFDRMRDFYTDWYRPDLMSIVAVGTLDADVMEKRIIERFGKIAKASDKPELPVFEVPDHKETLIKIVTDEEATSSSVSVMYKHPGKQMKTVGDFRKSIVESLFFSMVNQRLAELTQQADPPFLGASGYSSGFVSTKSFAGFGAGVKDGAHVAGLEATLKEVERVRRFGFTQSELDRQRVSTLRSLEQSFRERDKVRSRTYATRYIDSATSGDVSVGIEKSKALYEQLLPTISLAEINKHGASLLTEENRVLTAEGPKKDGVTMPTEAELLGVFDTVAKAELTPYEETLADSPLVAELPPAATITKREQRDDVGTHIWELDNGCRIIVKPTNFKADQILFNAFRFGGVSLAVDSNYTSAAYASGVASMGGLGEYSLVDLGKKLTGKVVSVSPYIGSELEGISGSCSPQDLETMFELIVAYRQYPRRDPDVFESFVKRQVAALEHRLARPEAVWSDEIRKILSQDHPRRQPTTPDTIRSIDLDNAMAFYRERFTNPGSTTYVFVGNVDLDKLEAMVTKYLGGGSKSTDTWRDEGVRKPTGPVEHTTRKGIEPKAQVMLSWWGDFAWGYGNRHAIRSMVSCLNIKLRERIREDLGGTYSISAYVSVEQIPQPTYSINVNFGCNPEEVEKLLVAVQEEIAAIQNEPMDDLTVTKIREQQLRERETSMKENTFWRSVLGQYEQYGEDPSMLFQLQPLAKALTGESIQATAKSYFSTNNTGKFLLLPEEDAEEK